jgi:uncharacterized tellurite resistance protein B-like protein
VKSDGEVSEARMERFSKVISERFSEMKTDQFKGGRV